MAVVLTGMGPVTPVGTGNESFLDGWSTNRPGIRRLTQFDAAGYPCQIGGEIDLDMSPWLTRRQLRTLDRFSALALVAADLALEDSGCLGAVPAERVGVFLGAGVGGAESWLSAGELVANGKGAQIGPRILPNGMVNGAAANISIRYGFHGPNVSPSSACSSGLDAVVAAYHAIELGEVDVAVAGGADSGVSPVLVGGFGTLGALSTRNDTPETACRPFSADRDGFVLGEGAGVVILESESSARSRGAHVLARILGYGRSSDAYHITQPNEEGLGAARAMRFALASAGLEPSRLDHVSAHGTGTLLNDISEARAIRTVFGSSVDRLPVSSLKGQVGHAIGASGAIALIACVQAMGCDMVPGTTNLVDPDPSLGLNVVAGAPRQCDVRTAMINSNAFGGQSVSVVIGRADAPEVLG